MALRYQADANNVDLVVARGGDEVTLKRFRKTDKRQIRLEPESYDAEHEAIEIDPRTNDWGIVGVVVRAIICKGPTPR